MHVVKRPSNRLSSALHMLALVVGSSQTAAFAHAIPDVAGVRLGMTSGSVVATLQSRRIAAARTFTPCLREDLDRAAGKSFDTGPGHCLQELDARYAGGSFVVRFTEDLPKRPGVSVVTTVAIIASTDRAVFNQIIQRAGRPSLTDGKNPWAIARWCFDSDCSSIGRTLGGSVVGATLFVNREDEPGLTLEDAQMRTSRQPHFARLRARDPHTNYASTPRLAAQNILFTLDGAPLVFERVNVVGRYATVLSNGEVMPEAADHQPILLKRFKFGWQPLVPGPSRCEFDGRLISRRDQDLLLRGMPRPADDRPCGVTRAADFGPPATVETLRRMRGEQFVPSAMVAGNFALVTWMDGPTGGEALYSKRGVRWQQVSGGGGALNANDLRARGVPRAAICIFGAFGATCPKVRKPA